MTSEMQRHRLAPRELDAEGARLGASFGLGGPVQGVCMARRRSTQWRCGWTLIVAAVLSVFIVPGLQHHFTAAWWIGASGTVLAGVVLMTLAPRARWDRLYWYPGGIAQRLSGEREPKILHWADATAVRVKYYDTDDSRYLEEITVDGPAGMSIRADHDHKQGRDKLGAFAQEAERVLAARLLPGLIEAYQRGGPIVFGALTIDYRGLSGQPQGPKDDPWQLGWRDIRTVEANGPGRQLRVLTRQRLRAAHNVDLEQVPNGMLAHHLIEHVAAPYGVRVKLHRE